MNDCQVLPPREARTIAGATGHHLHVMQGRLWLTQSGEGIDHFLGPGNAITLGAGRVVVEAEGNEASRYQLVAPEGTQPRPTPARWPREIPTASVS